MNNALARAKSLIDFAKHDIERLAMKAERRQVGQILVVMATHNSSHTIVRALRSVDGALNGCRYSLVIADDASTDNTVGLIHECRLSAENRVVRMFSKASSVSAAKNRAVQLALKFKDSHQWSVFVDPDDELMEGVIDTIYELQRDGGQFGIGNWMYSGMQGRRLMRAEWSLENLAFPPGASVISSALLPANGQYWEPCPAGVHEDVLTYAMMRHRGVKMRSYCTTPAYTYHHGGFGVSGDDCTSGEMMQRTKEYLSERLTGKGQAKSRRTSVILQDKQVSSPSKAQEPKDDSDRRIVRCESAVTKTPAIVQLGRIGDILNILPVAALLNLRYPGRPKIRMVVHESMAGTLDRIGYVQEEQYNGPINDRDGAVALASKYDGDVFVPQLFHAGGVDTGKCKSYNIDQYARCGFADMFGALPLEIDRRHWASETAWLDSVHFGGSKIICCNLGGVSSPFPYRANVEQLLGEFDGECGVLDLGKHKASCITDQLAALDDCAILITADTAHLHLAQASHCPYIALLSDHGGDLWKGSQVVRSPVLSMRYSDVPSRLGEIRSAICAALSNHQHSGRVLHVVNRRKSSAPRVVESLKNHQALYASGHLVQLDVWSTPRLASVALGDNRPLPFMRDVLEQALGVARDEDILLFTNDDIYITKRAIRQAVQKLKVNRLVTGARIDVKSYNGLDISGDSLWGGNRHAGRDMFACKAGWLRANMWRVPDFIIGASEWDLVFAAMARKLAGFDVVDEALWMHNAACETSPGLLYHMVHEPTWNVASNVDSAPSQVHNRALADAWYRANTPRVNYFWMNK